MIDALCKIFGTKKRFGLAYHPASQGGVERKNRTVISELSKRVSQFGPTWADHIPWLEFCLNTVPHSSTGFTPYRLMYGREARTPFSNELPPVRLPMTDSSSRNFVEKSKEQVEQARAIAMENHELYRTRPDTRP